MDKEILVSIITVVLNGALTIEETVRSVIGQTYKNVEYIIIDGGSSDGTMDILRKYNSHISKIISEPDEGLYDAMNKGINEASGVLIGIINSDDWYEENAVELVVKRYLENQSNLIIHGNTWYVHENHRRYKKYVESKFRMYYLGVNISHPSTFIHRSVYDYGGYLTRLKITADSHFFLTHYLKRNEIFSHLNEPLANFRLGGVSTETSFFKRTQEGIHSRRLLGFKYHQILIFVVVRSASNFIHLFRR